MILHILERFAIHFASATFLTLAFYFLLKFLGRKYPVVARWISMNRIQLILFSAVLVFAFLPLREAYDVGLGGQPWYKALTDQISWLLGAGVAAWGLYRFALRHT